MICLKTNCTHTFNRIDGMIFASCAHLRSFSSDWLLVPSQKCADRKGLNAQCAITMTKMLEKDIQHNLATIKGLMCATRRCRIYCELNFSLRK